MGSRIIGIAVSANKPIESGVEHLAHVMEAVLAGKPQTITGVSAVFVPSKIRTVKTGAVQGTDLAERAVRKTVTEQEIIGQVWFLVTVEDEAQAVPSPFSQMFPKEIRPF